MSERLTVDDAAFLGLENRVSATHSVTVAVFEGPEASFEEITDRLASRVGMVPRLRQRVVWVPFGVERPVWVDDPDFSLDYHVRHTGLPANGGSDALGNLVGRVMSQRLDRGKPLWELWVVSGLDDGRWAVISKAHYSMVDGVSGMDPLSLVVDQAVVGKARAEAWDPDPIPSDATLLTSGLTDLAFDPAQQIRNAKRHLVDPIRKLSRTARSQDVPMTPAGLPGAIGPFRNWAQVTLPVEPMRSRRRRLDVSTNDVVLAVVTAGFRHMFEQGGLPIPADLHTLVPLAIATGDSFTNEMSALAIRLPTTCDGLDDMIRAINAQTEGTASGSTAAGLAAMRGMKGLSAPTLVALGVRTATRVAATTHGYDTVAASAPGSREALSLLGQSLVTVAPALPLVDRVPISVGSMSMGDELHVGITGSRASADRIRDLAAGMVAAVEELQHDD